MYVKQLYTNCLSEAAYFIESEGEAAIIDPIREIEPYIELAKERGVHIKYIFETHFHADFVSGHIDLAKATGANIIYGPGANTNYKVYNAYDGEIFKIGKTSIKAIHTPGHTLESTCYLLLDENEKEYAVFSGDTLFVGDAGRPDLLDGVATKEDLAGMLYDSLNNKIKKLPDDVILYPAHGPGSQCGKNIGKETWSTIGQQKKYNYTLQDMSKSDFIRLIIEGLAAPPAYFFNDAKINKEGYENIEYVVQRGLRSLDLNEFENLVNAGAVILDTRKADDFGRAFIKDSINIGLNGTFAVWVGTLIDIKQALVLITEPGKEKETVTRLARVGYENVRGYLQGGIINWLKGGKTTENIVSIDAQEFANIIKKNNKNIVLDVRKLSELENGYVKGAVNISLAELQNTIDSLDKNAFYLVHCAGGYRSMIACSLLKAKGFNKLKNISGGFSSIKETAVDIEKVATQQLVK